MKHQPPLQGWIARFLSGLRHGLLALGAALVFAPGFAWAQNTFNINAGTGTGTGWSFVGGVLTITGDVTITGTGAATANRIVVTGAPRHITLGNGVNIDRTGATLGMTCAFDLGGSAIVFLTLAAGSDTTLTSGPQCAGLHVPNSATLTIDGPGKLTARGGVFGAGIGGSYGETGGAGNITINNGEIAAYGGAAITNGAGAGIGGGGGVGAGSGDSGAITINGGTITAQGGAGTGGYGGAGIGGGGLGSGEFITITGGVVHAIGGNGDNSYGGAGIGGGASVGGLGGAGGTIVITGGTVQADGGDSGAGIGGGRNGDSGNITITVTGSDTVTATGGDAVSGITVGGGAGIGGGGLSSLSLPSSSAINIPAATLGNVTATGGSTGYAFGNGANIGNGGIMTPGFSGNGTDADTSGAITPRTVAVTQAAGGTIAPDPASGIPDGANQTFLVTPDTGWRIASVTVDGVTYAGAYPSWTIAAITGGNHNITATFALISGGNGSGTATAVPTLNEWALALLALTMLGLAGWGYKRRI